MRIAFVFMGAENLGIEYLSSVARAAGHETMLFFDPAPFSGKLMLDSPLLARLTDITAPLKRNLVAAAPDVVAFSCFTGNYLCSLDVARHVKKHLPSAAVIFGGVHVSSSPEVVFEEDCVDALLVGEGESVFTRLAEAVANKKPEPIPGAWIRTPGGDIRTPPQAPIADLDALPFPDKNLFYEQVPALEAQYMIMGARGCPYSCTYCHNKSFEISSFPGSKPVRQRSVDNVIEELRPWKKRGVTKLTVFRDDVFAINKKWLAEFTEKYPREIGLPYFCYTHPGAVDAEKADMLKRGGCVFTTMGIQSADDTVRRELLNRNYSNEQARESVELLKKGGIAVSLDHIAGLPGETEQHLIDAARFYASLRPDRSLIFWLEYLPGTRMMGIAIERGLLSAEEADRIRRGHAVYRYTGGAHDGSPDLPRIVNFMYLIPLLPQSFIDRMIRWGFARRFPKWTALQHLLMTATAVLKRDPFFRYNIRYMFSRKRLLAKGCRPK